MNNYTYTISISMNNIGTKPSTSNAYDPPNSTGTFFIDDTITYKVKLGSDCGDISFVCTTLLFTKTAVGTTENFNPLNTTNTNLVTWTSNTPQKFGFRQDASLDSWSYSIILIFKKKSNGDLLAFEIDPTMKIVKS